MIFEEDIKECIYALEKGGTIVYPTDTIWGIGCDATNEQAVEQVFQLKNRPKEKSLIVLLAEAKDILQYIAAPHPDIIDIVENFNTPTTVIYDGAIHFPGNVVHENGTIGIRVTTDPFCKALIKRFRKPIISTSANLSGQPSARYFEEIDNSILKRADYVVKYRRDDNSQHQPSRIVRIAEDGSLEILRP